MIKLNKEEIKQIALGRFHDKRHESVYDCWTDALEVWLNEKGYRIVTIEDAALISARDHQELSRGYKRSPKPVKEAKDERGAKKSN